MTRLSNETIQTKTLQNVSDAVVEFGQKVKPAAEDVGQKVMIVGKEAAQ